MDRNPSSELPHPSSEPGSAAAPASGNLHGLFDASWERFKAHWLGLSAAAAATLVLIVAVTAGAASVYLLGESVLGLDPAWLRVFLNGPDAVDPTMLAKTLALNLAHNLGSSALLSAATF